MRHQRLQGQFDSLRPSDRAPNLIVGDRVEIDETAQIGANVVLHDDVKIGPGVVIKHNAVLGQLRAYSAASRGPRVTPDVTRIEADATVCSHTVIFAGAILREGAMLGDYGMLGAHVELGPKSVVGGASQVGVGAVLGPRVRIQNGTFVSRRAILEEDAFVGPGVQFTANNTPMREEANDDFQIILRRACIVSAGVIFTPGVEVGEEAFIAAGTVVVSNVGPRVKIKGVPGREYGMVTDEELLENWR